MSLSAAVERYFQLERGVQALMGPLCGPQCAACEAVCCNAGICVETTEVPWLKQVRRVAKGLSKKYNPDTGWLTATGCGLTAGRPPVCYGFFCDRLITTLDPERAFALRVAGRLLFYAGARALGDRHLCEVTEPEDLNRFRPERLLRKIDEALEALAVCEAVVGDGRLDGERLAGLKKMAGSIKNTAIRTD